MMMFPLCAPPLRSMGVAVSDLMLLDSFSVPSLRSCVAVFNCSSSVVVVAVSVPIVVASSVPLWSILSLLFLLSSSLLAFVLVFLVFLLSSALPGGSSQFLFSVVGTGMS